MDLFLQQVSNGIMGGFIYALVALGLTMVYGVMDNPDFAMGHKGMIGAYIAFFAITGLGVGFWFGLVAGVLSTFILGWLLYQVMYRHIENGPHADAFIVAFGLTFVLENFALKAWGFTYRQISVPYLEQSISIFGVKFTLLRLVIIAVALILLMALTLMIKKTKMGKAIRAVSQSKEGAALIGVDVYKISAFTMSLGSALAAVAAVLYAPISMVYAAMGTTLIIKALVVVVWGIYRALWLAA